MRSSTLIAFVALAIAGPALAAPVSAPPSFTTANATVATPAAAPSTTLPSSTSLASLTPEQSAAMSLITIGAMLGYMGESGEEQQSRDTTKLAQLLARQDASYSSDGSYSSDNSYSSSDSSSSYENGSSDESDSSDGPDSSDDSDSSAGDSSLDLESLLSVIEEIFEPFLELLSDGDSSGNGTLSGDMGGYSMQNGTGSGYISGYNNANSTLSEGVDGLLTRQDVDSSDESGAFSLDSIFDTASSLLGSLFGGSSSSSSGNSASSSCQQRSRELANLRRDVLELNALVARKFSLSSFLSDSEKILEPALKIIPLFFERELKESEELPMLSRQEADSDSDSDESDALSLSSLGSIFKIGSSVLGGLFGGSSSESTGATCQQRSRELANLRRDVVAVNELVARKFSLSSFLSDSEKILEPALKILPLFFERDLSSSAERRELVKVLSGARLPTLAPSSLPRIRPAESVPTHKSLNDMD